MNSAHLLTRAFLLAWISHALHGFSFNLYLHLPGFLRARGATEFHIGILFAVGATAAIFFKPWVGRHIDRNGAQPMILAGGALSLIACCGYAYLAARPGRGGWIYATRILQTVSMAMLFTALYAYVADILPEARRIEGLGLFGISGVLPIGLGGLAGDFLLGGREDYRSLFTASIALTTVALGLSIPLRAPARARTTGTRRGSTFLRPRLRSLWFAGLVLATMVATYFTYLKTFVQSTGVGSVGLFFGAYSVAAVLVRAAGGKLPVRLGPKRVLVPAMGAVALGFILLARGTSPRDVALAGLAFGMGQGYAFPILVGLVVERAPREERGAALAIFTSFFDAGTLVGAPLFGFLVRATNYSVMFVTAATLCAAATGLFAWWDGKLERSS